jgi:hypothetical protein
LSSSKDKPKQGNKSAGEVRHDERGHAVWQWASDSARHAITSTSALLRRLDVSGLSIAEDPAEKKAAEARKPTVATSINGRPIEAKPAAVAAAARPAAARSAATPSAARAGAVKPAAAPAALSPESRAASKDPWWRRLFRRE